MVAYVGYSIHHVSRVATAAEVIIRRTVTTQCSRSWLLRCLFYTPTTQCKPPMQTAVGRALSVTDVPWLLYTCVLRYWAL